jgi:hypothetical protein
MDSQLAYLKSVIEGAPDIEPWRAWFERNDQQLQNGLKRTAYLELKLNRIKAIPAILKAHGIAFVESDRYAFLGGIAGRCRDCGATVETSRNFDKVGGMAWCPNGCFKMHVSRHP